MTLKPWLKDTVTLLKMIVQKQNQVFNPSNSSELILSLPKDQESIFKNLCQGKSYQTIKQLGKGNVPGDGSQCSQCDRQAASRGRGPDHHTQSGHHRAGKAAPNYLQRIYL